MPSVTYFVVVPFHHDYDGMLVPSELKEAPNEAAARRRAFVMAPMRRSAPGDPDSTHFKNSVILGGFGKADEGARAPAD